MPTIPCVRLDIANPVLLALLHKCATQAGMRVLDQDDTQAPDLLVRQPGPDLEDEAEQLERFQARNRDAAIFLHMDATVDISKFKIVKNMFPETAGKYAGPE